jgi:hypothetical protein
VVILSGAVLVAAGSARPYAGSWNDGSRLATVESLVDYHTLAIDDSIFVRRPPSPDGEARSPYPADDPFLKNGTGDKLIIHGHYYSDKSPVPALLMAGLYQAFQGVCGLKAGVEPERFCYALTLGSSGLAYVLAVWCVFRLGRPLDLAPEVRLLLTASFGLATVALPYARHVNNHVLLLGVAAGLLLNTAWVCRDVRAGRMPWLRLVGLGTLTGLGYTIDLGAGPVLLVCTLAWVAYRCGPLRSVLVFAAAALPWFAFHHAVNYAVGGTLKPANAVPEYFLWPGSSFNPQNLTGGWSHRDLGHFATYAAALLVGKRGFVGHNLPLFLAAWGAAVLLRRRLPERAEVLFAASWCGGTWLMYAAASNNYSGQCCSIRWFVPLLAPAYYLLALLLREQPRYRADLALLSGWGALLAGMMWWYGPWMRHLVPGFWPLQAAALLSWLGYARWRRRKERESFEDNPQQPRHRAEAA